jgi:hypothetical protein
MIPIALRKRFIYARHWNGFGKRYPTPSNLVAGLASNLMALSWLARGSKAVLLPRRSIQRSQSSKSPMKGRRLNSGRSDRTDEENFISLASVRD